jgi:hypothetical protein
MKTKSIIEEENKILKKIWISELDLSCLSEVINEKDIEGEYKLGSLLG